MIRKEKGERREGGVIQLLKDIDMVFPSTIGTPIDPTNILKNLRKALKIAGLPRIRFQDLRNTSVSIMLNSGIDLLVASRRRGHAKPSITLDVYGHLLSSGQDEVANKIEKLLGVE